MSHQAVAVLALLVVIFGVMGLVGTARPKDDPATCLPFLSALEREGGELSCEDPRCDGESFRAAVSFGFIDWPGLYGDTHRLTPKGRAFLRRR